MGSGQSDGSGNQDHLRAGPGRSCSDGIALFARRTVGDVADRIDRLMGRPGGNNDFATAEARSMGPLFASRPSRPTPSESRQKFRSGSAMRPGPNSPQAIAPSFGPINSCRRPAIGPDFVASPGEQHPPVHRRRREGRLSEASSKRGGKVVGQAMRRLGQADQRWPGR